MAPEPERAPTLYVDLDGTLIRSDLLIETVLTLLRRNALYIFLLPFWLLKGRAHLKRMVAERAGIVAASLPYNHRLIGLLKEARAQGRRLVLASASDGALVRQVADHLGLFDDVLGSDGEKNRKAGAKLAAIRKHARGELFDYAGNEAADIVIMREARQAILVDPDRRLLAAAGTFALAPVVLAAEPAGIRTYLRALRPLQWMKNLLVFAPILLDHRLLEAEIWQAGLVAFIAFGLCASSVYVLNDLVDLAADREHPRKRNRPFASGRLPLLHGVIMAPLLLAGAFLVTLQLPWQFAAALGVYYLATLSYSLFLKRTLLLDVLTLAGLYTLRIIAGSLATGIDVSFWLLAFSIFVFFSLSLVKRFVELTDKDVVMSDQRKLKGRGYRIEDTETLAQFGTGSGLAAVLVLALYVRSPEVYTLYRTPEVIWLICPILLYLVCRIWVLARRGEMHDDPLVFAVTDWRSILMVAVAGILLLVAK